MTVIRELPVYDLRKIKSLEEAAVINAISDVAVLIYPKNGDGRLLAALRSIPTENIAFTVYLNDEDCVYARNGACELTDNSFSKERNNVYVINGVCFMHDVSPLAQGIVIVNGILAIDEDLKGKHSIELPFVNGRIEYVKAKRMLSYDNKVVLSRQYLQYVKKNTLLVAGNKIIIDGSVEICDLVASEITLVAINKIMCESELIPYITATAIFGNKVCEL